MVKKLIALLSCLLSFGVAACTGKRSGVLGPGAKYIDWAGEKGAESQNAFFISGWSAPPSTSDAATNEKRFREVKDAGFNHINSLVDYHNAALGNNSLAIRALNAAGSAGIGYNVLDTGIRSLSPQLISSAVSAYKDMPAFYGHLVTDEPGIKDFDKIAAHYQKYKEILSDKNYYVNLLPTYASEEQLYHGAAGGVYTGAAITYEDYVGQYITKVKPSVISYDHYPFREDAYGDRKLTETYLRNMEVISEKSGAAGLDFWLFIQAMSITPKTGTMKFPEPGYEDIRWQVFSSLVYGARGIQYFCYWTPDDNTGEDFGDSMVDKNGEKTPIYGYVKDINTEIRSFEDIFFEFKWKGTIPHLPTGTATTQQVRNTVNGLKSALTEHKRIASFSTERPLLIGAFEDAEGADGFLVMNYSQSDLKQDSTVNLKFNNAVKAVVCMGGERKVVTLTNGELKLELEAGQGAFVIPVGEKDK